MTDELFPYLNEANGLVGHLTREQAVAMGDHYKELEAVEVPVPTPEELAAEAEEAAAQAALAQAALDEAAAQAAANPEGPTV